MQTDVIIQYRLEKYTTTLHSWMLVVKIKFILHINETFYQIDVQRCPPNPVCWNVSQWINGTTRFRLALLLEYIMLANSQFRCFGRFLSSPYIFHPASPKFPPSTPFVFGNFPPSINPLFHAHKTRSFVHFKGCGSATNIFVYVSQYLPQHHSLIINDRGKFLAQSLRPC